MAAAGALGSDGARGHGGPGGMVDVEPRGAWSSGSGVYYSLDDKTFCAELHGDSAQIAGGNCPPSLLVSVPLTMVTGRLVSGISSTMTFPDCPRLVP